jgi:hypothetical protein
MAERQYRWFMEPLDEHTNKTIGKELSEENALRDVRDNEGRKHNVWLFGDDLGRLRAFVNSKKTMCLNFNVYVQKGGGKIRCVNFLFGRRKRQGKTKKAAS